MADKNKFLKLKFDKDFTSGIEETTTTIEAPPYRLPQELSSLAANLPVVLGPVCQGFTPDYPNLRPPSYKELYELTIIISGYGTYTVGDKKYSFKKGDVFFFKPGTFHSVTKDSMYSFRTIHFRFDNKQDSSKGGPQLEDEFRKFLTDTLPNIIKISLTDDTQVLFKAKLLFNEYTSNEAGRDMLLSIQLLELLILVMRNYLSRQQAQTGGDENNTHHTMVHHLLRIFNMNYYQDLDINKILKSFQYNVNYSRDVFKRIVGVPINRYLLDRRLEAGRKLLLERDWSAKIISHEVGIKSYQQFNQAFKQKYGLSPIEYRKKNFTQR